jgi:iron complex outermembrane recepter protein
MKVTNPMVKAAMLTTISISALSFGSAAYAQAESPAEEAVAGEEEPIIVTATKREKTLQEVPVAVSVTSAEAIQRAQVRDLNDLQTLVPALRVGQLQSSANTNFIIRGFGNGANNLGIEPSVAVFIDGVYRSRSASSIGDLPNLKRVEVLRGPQSTLFGKNASAGVISVVTAEPKYKFGGSAEFSYGNYNAIVAKADVTGPIIADKMAFSLAGGINKRDGYVTNLVSGSKGNERNRWFTRGQLLIEPSETVKFRFIGDYDTLDENCCAVVNVFEGPTTTASSTINLIRAVGGNNDTANPFSYNEYIDFPSTNKIDNYGFSGQADFELSDSLDLTSISAYRVSKVATNQDSDFTSADLIGSNAASSTDKTFTQELRLATNFDGPINVLVGGYYFNEDIKQNNSLLFGTDFRPYGNLLLTPLGGIAAFEGALGTSEGNAAKYAGQFFKSGAGLTEAYTLKDTSYSLFGTVDFEITDRLTLTGGLNYTDDRKTGTTNVVSTDVFSAIDLDAAVYAPYRRQLLIGGGLAQFGVNPNNPAAVGAFATGATTAPIFAAIVANANANQNNPAANPLNAVKGFQFLPQFLNFPNSVESGKTADNNLSYTVRLAYKATDSINVYASYATGFKASSFNLSRDSRPALIDRTALIAAGLTKPNQTYGSRFAKPENAKVYEVGLKGKWDQVAFNLTAFKQSIEGFQSNIFSGTGFSLANAGKQSTFGIEFDGTVAPVEELTLSVAMVYLDAKYDSFPNFDAAGTDLSGRRVDGVPEISMTLGATWAKQLSDFGKLIVRGDYHYESPTPLGATSIATFVRPQLSAYSRQVDALNASIGLELENGLSLSVWGRNLTDAKYLTTLFPTTARGGDSISGYPSQPKTYGVSARFKF